MKDTIRKKKYAAGRLVQTEQAYFHARSSLDCFSELGVDKLEFIATLDSRTSEICQSMDGVVFAAKDSEIGVNVPPLHPNCRSVTAPYFEDDAGRGMRAARDPETGKTYYVPDNIAYKQWRGKFVEGTPEKTSPISVGTSKVDIEYIKSDGYRRKFDALSDNPKLNSAVCKYARASLIHQSGGYYEDIAVVSSEDKLICQKSNVDTPYEVKYTKSMKDKIKKERPFKQYLFTIMGQIFHLQDLILCLQVHEDTRWVWLHVTMEAFIGIR